MSKNNQADFNSHISKVSQEKKDMYFQMPKNMQKYVDDKSKVDRSLEGVKTRLEEQLNNRKKYVELLEEYRDKMKEYNIKPSEENEKAVKYIKNKIDLHNIEIEITAQQNVFVDSYIYYKEDFMERYKKGGGKKKSVFKK